MVDEFRPLIKNTKFIYVWISQILSQLTINIMNFLLLIRLFNVTGSAIATSLLWVSYAIPAIMIGPLAAAIVDMTDRRKMLMVTNLLQAGTILAYAFLHETRFFLLYGVVFVYSLLNQFYVPAESASIPSVVRPKHLPYANGLFLLTQQAAMVLGFGIAGILNHLLGFTNALFLCAGFVFVAFISVSFLPELKVEEVVPRNIEQAIVAFFSRISEGYHFIKSERGVLPPFLLLIASQVSSAMVIVNVPVLAAEIFKVNANSIGTLIAVPAGLGAGLGAVVIPKLLRKGLRKKVVIENSLMVLGILMLMLGFLVPEIPGGFRIASGVILSFFSGLSFIGLIIPSQTFLQEATPGGMRGRVFGNFWFLLTIATVLPVIFSGTLTELLGVKSLFLILAGFAVAGLVMSKKYGQRILENGSI
jgi:MFS family permease